MFDLEMFIVILLLPLVASRHVFVSSPFDNFRMECPKRAAAVDLSIRMVESVGAKRQDVVFDMSCEGIDELFPWVNIPVGISNMEREDCYYSPMFDPILDETSEFSCKRREYLAGITRLTDTRVQLMCCRLRSRDEFNCQETIFNKPIGPTKSTIIEHENRLINAIRLEESTYIVRFCDLAPRNIAEIYDDVKMRTTRHHLSTSTKSSSKVTKLSAPLLTATALPTTPSPTHRFPTTTSPNPFHEHLTQPSLEVSAATSHHLKSIEEDFNSGNSISEPEEFIHTSGTKTAKGFHSARYSPPSLLSTTNTHILTTSTANTATTVIPSREEPSNGGTEVEDHQIFQKHKDHSLSNDENIYKEIQRSSSKPAEKLLTNAVANFLNDREPVNSVMAIKPSTKDHLSSTPVPTNVSSVPSTSTTMVKITEEFDDKLEEGFNERKIQEDSIKDFSVSDLSLITFRDEEFPRASEKKFAIPAKFKVSKTDLPLKNGVSVDDFVFLGSINSDGHRRAPIRTHRPHVEIWSSEEDMSGGDSSWEHTTVKTTTPRKVVKLRKKVTRAHRLSTNNKPNEWYTDYATTSPEKNFETTDVETTTRGAPKMKITTTASLRRDMASSRRVKESMTYKVDNAHSVDEETLASPFEDEEQVLSGSRRSNGSYANLYLRGDEDIEEVIMKLSATTSDIRRAPVRNSDPKEQKSDKNAEESENAKENEVVEAKDGNKTFISKGFPPNPMPEMAIFENQHKGDLIVEDITKVGSSKENEARNTTEKSGSAEDELADVTRSLVLMNSKSFIGGDVLMPSKELSKSRSNEESMAIFTRTPSTTEYNPAMFYHTPVAKPLKKEKLLTFCTKDVALRDKRNMVVACGGAHDIWLPTRCPQGADCFIAQDSTYRLCCPVSSG